MPRPLPQPIRGPVRCSRAARLRCPRMSSRAARAARGMSALALGLLQLIRGPVRCSRAARPALLRCPRTPSAGMSALALGLLLVLAAAVRAEERSVALAVAIEFESFELNRERVVPPGRTVAVYVSG